MMRSPSHSGLSSGISLLLLILVATPEVHADAYHYDNFRHGQNAMGLGGAVTAVSGEPETSFYNPAGLAEIKGTVLAGSIQFFGKDKRTLRNGFGRDSWFSPQDQVSDTFLATPSSSVFTLNLGSKDHVLAFGAFLLSQSSELFDGQTSAPLEASPEWNEASSVSYTSALTRSDRLLNFGVAYGWRQSSLISWGASAFYARRDQEWNLAASEWRLPTDNTDGRVAFTEFENFAKLEDGSFVARFGVLVHAAKILDFGLACSTPSVQLHGSGRLGWGAKQSDTAMGNLPDLAGGSDKEFNATTILPWNCRAGTAIKLREGFSVSFDAAYHGRTQYQRMEVPSNLNASAQLLASVFPLTVKIEPVTNFAVGAQVELLEDMVWRGGFYSNLSAAPRIPETPTQAYGPEVDLQGITSSLGYKSGNQKINLGASYQWGEGYDVVPNQLANFGSSSAENYRRVEREEQRFMFFLSGSIELEEVLSPDPQS